MTTIPEWDVMTLAARLLNQLHTSLAVDGDTILCKDCLGTWRATVKPGTDSDLDLKELEPGIGVCEAEVLRVISTPGLFSELGRRRVKQRKTVSRAGGRPKLPAAERCQCGIMTKKRAAQRRHVCRPADASAGDGSPHS